MLNPSVSIVQPGPPEENKFSIHNYLEQSYTQTKRKLQDGMTLFKEEFIENYDKAGACLDRMLLPVNNFLKDFTQIEEDFREELTMDTACVIPIEQAVACDKMEENY